MTSTRNIPVRSWKWILQAAALLALAVVVPACGGGGGGGVIIPPFTITTTSLPNGTVATVYPNQTLTTVSGTAPITWALVNGTALPAGMALAPATGVISGTPTGPSAGISSFMLRATDANGLTADRVLSIAVTGGAPAALTVTSSATLPAGTQNSLYSAGLSASGGTPPYTWAITVGTLPAGLSLNGSMGLFGGIPTAAGGPTNFTVRVTDSLAATATLAMSLTINPGLTVTTLTLPPTTTTSTTYNQALTQSGGTAPYTWALIAGVLPTGLTLSPAGVISGTVTGVAINYGITVEVTDSASAKAAQFLTILVNPVPSVTTAALLPWTQGLAGYSQTLVSAGGTAPITWSITPGTLPAGLALNPGTGAITGLPTVAGTSNFTAVATDAAGVVDTQALSIVVNASIVVAPVTLPGWTINRPLYSQVISSTGGTGARTLAVTAGTVPTGMTFTPATGVLAGTPTGTGTANFTVTSTDSLGATGSQAYSVVISPVPTIATTTLPNWTINRAYNQTLLTTAATGTAPFSWAITAGTQPTGLALSAGGVLSGTPTATGPFTFTVTVTDVAGATASQQYTSLTINPAPTIATTTLPNWTISRPYNQTLLPTAATGTVPFSWAITAGTQPTSLTLSAGGVLSGTPSATGPFTFTVTLTDAAGATATQQYTSLTINPAPTIATATLPNWTINRAYNQTLLTTAATGTAPFGWAITAGTQPTGLALSAGGVLSGTPTVAGQSTFTVTVTDAAGATATQQYTNLTINPVPTIATTTLPDWTQSFAYSQTLLTTASTGTAPFSWAVTTGAEPAGLTLSAAGVLSGTPTTVGQTTFTVTVTDAAGATATQQYLNLTISASMVVTTSTPMPAWTQNKSGYSQTLASTGGTGTKTWAISVPALPTSLTLNAGTGEISGTPSVAGTFNFTVQVTDSVGATATKAMSIVIADAMVVTTATPMQAWTQDKTNYNQSLAASGGTGAKTWAITLGGLPTSLSMDTAGVITGTPTVAGTFNFTVTVTDAVSATASKAMSIVINDPLLVTTATPMAAWTEGLLGYTQLLGASGGTGTKTWAISVPALPTNLTLNPGTGEISGTPSAAGTFNFTVQVTDSVGATATKAMSIVINASLAITTASPLPGGTQGVSYGPLSFVATGGTGTKTFTMTSGSIPTGMTAITTDGVLGGIPTGSGPSTFEVTVTDSLGATAAKSFSLTIAAAGPLSITTTVLPDAIVGSGYRVAVQVVGGIQPYTWAVSLGSLPAPLGLNATTGIISGVPGAPGIVNVTITVTDSTPVTPLTDSQAFQFDINLATPAQGSLTIGTTRLPDAPLGPYTETIAAKGGNSSYLFAVDPAGNQLPASLSMAADGTVSGTVLAGDIGQYTITVIVSDTSIPANVARANVLLVVGPPVAPLAITTNSLPAGTSGVAYPPTRLVAVGGEPPYTWSTSEDTEGPQGMVLTSTGIFYGIPRHHGEFRTVFRVRDNAGRTTTWGITYTIAEPSTGFRVQSLVMPNATVGSAYSHQFTTAGGAAQSWVSDSGALATVGLNFNTVTGQITSPPTGPNASGVFTFIVGAVGSGPAPRPSSLGQATLTIPPPAYGITTTSLPDIQQGENYSATLTVQGGTAPYTWAIASDSPDNSFPSGINLNPATGVISGMSTASNDNGLELIIEVTDFNAVVARAYMVAGTVKVRPSFSFGGFGPTTPVYVMGMGTEGSVYPPSAFPLSFAEQDLSETEMLTGYSLPAGMTIDAARRTVSGTPTVPGRYVLQFRVRDALGDSGGIEEPVQTSENPAILEILQAAGFHVANRALPSGREGVAYSSAVIPEGGSDATPYAYAVTSGALPPGLLLDAVNGTLSGTPTVAGTFAFEISVTQGVTVKMAYELPIDPKLAVTVLTDRLPDGPIGVSYNGTLYGIGAGPTWSDVGSATTFAALGLSLDTNTGVVTGSPTVPAGLYQVQVTMTSAAVTSTRLVHLLIEPLPIAAAGFKGVGFVGQAYATTIDPFGGTGPYTVTLVPGELLIPGISLSAAGLVSGTPTVQSTFSQLSVRIQDSTGRIGYGRFDGIIAGADAPALGFELNFDDSIFGEVGQTLALNDAAFAAQFGTAPYTYSLFAHPSRPDDLIAPTIGVVTNTGAAHFTGTFTRTGLYSVVLRATDNALATADTIIHFKVRQNFSPPAPTVDTMRVPTGSSAVPYPATQLRGFWDSAHTHDWAFDGAIPAGLSMDPQGVLSSVAPMAAGTYYFFVRHRDTTDNVSAFGRIRLVIE